MSTELTIRDAASILEQVVIGGDLSKLTPSQRVDYYLRLCDSLGLNALSKPFEYLHLQGKLVLYARKDATDQLRSKHDVSIGKPDIQFAEGLCIVSLQATGSTGRTDADLGIVPIDGLTAAERANAIMKAVTKAKRRVTLSLCGLGMLDESEIETIADARPVEVDEQGEIHEEEPTPEQLAQYERGYAMALALKADGKDINPEDFELGAGASRAEVVDAIVRLARAIKAVSWPNQTNVKQP